METKTCPACGGALTLKLQMLDVGSDGWSPLMAVLSESLTVDVYACPKCGKVELYLPETKEGALSEIPDGPLPSEAEIETMARGQGSGEKPAPKKKGFFRRDKDKPGWEL